MKKIILLLCIATLLQTCQSKKDKSEETSIENNEKKTDKRFEQLTKLVDGYAKSAIEKGHISSVSFAIYNHGAIYKNYYGTL